MRAVDGVQLTDGPDHGIGIVDDEAGLAVVDQLGDAGAAHADDRRARRERLDDDEPERLVPRDREEERRRLGEQTRFRGFVDLADEADALTIDVWLDLRLEPRPIAVVDLAREEQASPGAARHVDRHIGALGRGEAAEEGERRIRSRRRRARRVAGKVDAVVDGRQAAAGRVAGRLRGGQLVVCPRVGVPDRRADLRPHVVRGREHRRARPRRERDAFETGVVVDDVEMPSTASRNAAWTLARCACSAWRTPSSSAP